MSGSIPTRSGKPVDIDPPKSKAPVWQNKVQAEFPQHRNANRGMGSKIRPGYNTIDGPSRGAGSLAMLGNKTKVEMARIPGRKFYGRGPANLSTLLNGAPSQSGSTSRTSARSEGAKDYEQHYGNATGARHAGPRQQPAGEIPSFGAPPPRNLTSQRSKKQAANAEKSTRLAIELVDSDEEAEAQKRTIKGKGKEKARTSPSASSGLSPPPSEHHIGRRSPLPSRESSVELQSADDAISIRSGQSDEEELRSGGRAPPSVPSIVGTDRTNMRANGPPQLSGNRSFQLASKDDEKKVKGVSKYIDRMQNKHGIRVSQPTWAPSKSASVPTSRSRQSAKSRDNHDRCFKSTFSDEEQEEAHMQVHLDGLFFVNIGKLEVQDAPQVIVSSSREMTLKWTSGSCAPSVATFDLADVNAIRVMAKDFDEHPLRIINIKTLAGTAPFRKVCDALNFTPGKRPCPSIEMILTKNSGSDDQSWVELEMTLRRIRHFNVLGPAEFREIHRRMLASERWPESLYARLVDDDNDRALKQLPPRPRPRPSARNSSTPMLTRSAARPTSPPLKRADLPPKQVLCFPITGARAVTIFQSDVDKLQEGEFVNDTIIEFGLKYLLEEIKMRDPELHEQIYVFSSFFYKRYAENRRDLGAGYALVRKWTNKVQLFRKKYVVMPINENLHWYLAIVVNPLYAFRNEPRAEEAVLTPGKQLAVSAAKEDDMVIDDREPSNEIRSAALSDTTDDREGSSELAGLPRLARGSEGDTVMGEPAAASPSAEPATSSPSAEPGAAVPSAEPATASQSAKLATASPSAKSAAVSPSAEPAAATSSRSIPVEDLRSEAGGSPSWPSFSGPSDGIRNEGLGPLSGGGDGQLGGTRSRSQSDDDNPFQIVRDRKRPREQSIASGTSSRQPSPQLMMRRTSSRLGGNSASGLGSSTIELPSFYKPSPKRGPTVEDRRQWLEDGATVLVFDSLLQKHIGVKSILQKYLSFEMEDKHHIATEPANVKLEMIDVAMPKQTNFADCGLYLLHSFDRFFSNPALFKTQIIPAREAEHAEWRAEEAKTRRKWCRDLLDALAMEWKVEADRRRAEDRKRKLEEGADDSSDMSDTEPTMDGKGKVDGEAPKANATAVGGAEALLAEALSASREESPDTLEKNERALGFSNQIDQLTRNKRTF